MMKRLAWIMLVAVGGCSGPGANAPAAEEERPSFVRGERENSPSRKTSKNRPHPWSEEHGPFQADRFEIQAHRERARRAHQEAHSKQVLVMERFAHPACVGLAPEARRRCPMVSIRWTLQREVPGGVVLEAPGQHGARLQRRILCHIAFGQVHQADDACPLHVPGVRATAVQGEKGVRLTVVTDDASQVSELRKRVKALVE
jgi:hypothetical protein